MENLKDILSEWQNNFEFRRKFKTNPEQALKDAGFTLSENDLKKIRTLIETNEKLEDRINK